MVVHVVHMAPVAAKYVANGGHRSKAISAARGGATGERITAVGQGSGPSACSQAAGRLRKINKQIIKLINKLINKNN